MKISYDVESAEDERDPEPETALMDKWYDDRHEYVREAHDYQLRAMWISMRGSVRGLLRKLTLGDTCSGWYGETVIERLPYEEAVLAAVEEEAERRGISFPDRSGDFRLTSAMAQGEWYRV